MRGDDATEPGSARRTGVALFLAALAVSCVLAEGLVRALVRRDVDGQEWVRNVRVRPYRLPLGAIGDRLLALAGPDAFLAYDADLGWAPRPGARSRDGLRRIDATGVRSDRETAPLPAPGVLRIALFGDSFTFGDEVGQDETWGAALERALAARGTAAEVLNFGVNAYGLDQAYLRWRRDGRRRGPAVVVLGFQAEDALRDLNVFRPLYFAGSEVPLSKPRFVATDGDLTIVNAPTIPLARMPAVLAALDVEPLLAYERYFGPYAHHWWLASRAAALAVAALVDARANPFVLTDEGRDLAERIVGTFADDVRAAGAGFVIVHLPRREDLAASEAGAPLWYAPLLAHLESRFAVVHPVATATSRDDASFAPRGHYSARLSSDVGAALAAPVLAAARRR